MNFGDWYRVEVRPRLTPEAVFGGLALRGAGPEQRAACPLHGGRNRTALAVNTADMRWHCHSCGAGGDGLQWIAATAGLTRPGEPLQGAAFRDAVRLAADRVGLTLPDGASLSPAERARLDQARASWLAATKVARARTAALEAQALAAKQAAAQALWSAATPEAGILVRYLQERRCWPPPPVAAHWGLSRAPRRCRFAARAAIVQATRPLTVGGRGWQLPLEAAGAVCYAYTRPGEQGVAALQLDAITVEGRHPPARWRRGIGRRQGGASFRVPGLAGQEGWTAICEGEVTAIALAGACADVGEARAVGGADGLTPAAVAGADRVWLVGDADPPSRRGRRPGPQAMDRLARELTGMGSTVRLSVMPGQEGEDYADLLSDQIRSLEEDGRYRGLRPGAAAERAWRMLREERNP